MTDANTRIARSMWHRTRRKFLEWSGDEIDRRAGVTRRERAKAAASGILSAEYVGNDSSGVALYTITELGKIIAGDME